MNLKDMTKEELETLSYTDIAFLILKEEKQKMNTPTIFHKVCDLLGYSSEEYENTIGDFYTALTTDKRFVMLDNAEWDLRDNHSINISFDEDDEEEDEEELENEDEMEENENEEESEGVEEALDDEDIPDDEDDMDDLNIIEEDEELEEN